VVNVWILAAIGLLAAFVPAGVVLLRGTLMSRIAAVQLLSVITTLELFAIPMALRRPDLFGAAIASAILSLAGTVLYAWIAVRWLR